MYPVYLIIRGLISVLIYAACLIAASSVLPYTPPIIQIAALVAAIALATLIAFKTASWRVWLPILILTAAAGWFVPYNSFTTGAGVYPLLHAIPLVLSGLLMLVDKAKRRLKTN